MKYSADDTSAANPSAAFGRPMRGWRSDTVIEPALAANGPSPLDLQPRDSVLPFWGLLAFTFILFISPQSFIRALAPLHLAFATAALATLAYLIDRFRHGRPALEFTPETVIVLCLVGWAILTLPLSYWPGGSVGVLVGLYFKTLIVFWLLSHVVNTASRLRLVAWVLTLMAVPIALTAFVHLLSGDYIETGIAPDESRIVGYGAPLTGNPNDLALTLNLFLPLSVALLLGSRTPGVRAGLLLCVSLDALAIIATFSRAGFLTLSVTFITYLWTLIKRRGQHWVFLALFLAFAAVPFLPTGYLDRLSTIGSIESDPTGSAQARWRDTLAAVQYVAYHPLIGAGVGMDALALNEVRGPTWTEVHDAYLQYAVDLGVPGLVLFLLLLAKSVKGVDAAPPRPGREPGAEPFFHLAEGIRISLVAFSVSAFFHPVAYHFYFYYIAGLALAAKTIHAGAREEAVGALAPAERFSATPRNPRREGLLAPFPRLGENLHSSREEEKTTKPL